GKRMQLAVSHAKFTKLQRRVGFAAQAAHQPEMFLQRLALLRDGGRRRQVAAGEQRLGFTKDEWIADGAASYRHAVDTGFMQHADAIARAEDVAAAEDRALADVPLY